MWPRSVALVRLATVASFVKPTIRAVIQSVRTEVALSMPTERVIASVDHATTAICVNSTTRAVMSYVRMVER